MAQVIPIPWKDGSGSDGLGGVLEIRVSDIPHGACIKDLIQVVKQLIPQPSDTSKHRRVVECIELYGQKLPSTRSLDAILPTMKNTTPRLIASCRVVCIVPSAIPPDQPYVIYFKMLTGKTFPITCEYKDMVKDVKHRIQVAEGFPSDQFRLLLRSTELDDEVQFVLYGIPDGGTVYLVLKLRGGYQSPGIFADVSDNSLLNEREFSSSAPYWRVCRKGLNVEGICTNRMCQAFGRMVIAQNGFQAFNLLVDTMKCPVCPQLVKPVTCGFYDCSWKFEGVRTSDQCTMSSPWKDAFGEKYHRFDADSSHGTVQWDSLLIVVTRPQRKKAEDGSIAVAKADDLDSATALDEDDASTCAVCWSPLRQASSRESGSITTTQCGQASASTSGRNGAHEASHWRRAHCAVLP